MPASKFVLLLATAAALISTATASCATGTCQSTGSAVCGATSALFCCQKSGSSLQPGIICQAGKAECSGIDTTSKVAYR